MSRVAPSPKVKNAENCWTQTDVKKISPTKTVPNEKQTVTNKKNRKCDMKMKIAITGISLVAVIAGIFIILFVTGVFDPKQGSEENIDDVDLCYYPGKQDRLPF
eukprot:g8287.t1